MDFEKYTDNLPKSCIGPPDSAYSVGIYRRDGAYDQFPDITKLRLDDDWILLSLVSFSGFLSLDFGSRLHCDYARRDD